MRRLWWIGRERLVVSTALSAWTIWMFVITYLRISDRISAVVFLIWVSIATSSVAGLLIGIFLRRRIATPAAFRRVVVAVFTGIFGSILMIVFGFVYVTVAHTVGFRRGTLLDFALLMSPFLLGYVAGFYLARIFVKCDFLKLRYGCG